MAILHIKKIHTDQLNMCLCSLDGSDTCVCCFALLWVIVIHCNASILGLCSSRSIYLQFRVSAVQLSVFYHNVYTGGPRNSRTFYMWIPLFEVDKNIPNLRICGFDTDSLNYMRFMTRRRPRKWQKIIFKSCIKLETNLL